jgi:DNA-binding NtrC family response regulator
MAGSRGHKDSARKANNHGGGGFVQAAQTLYRSARNLDLLRLLETADLEHGSEDSVRISILRGMAWFDVGHVVRSLSELESAVSEARNLAPSIHFAAVFAEFLRSSDFLAADQVIPKLTLLRQLAAQAGDARSLSSLHLAVARVEGCRGHCSGAHHHLEMARTFASRTDELALACTVDAVAASLETVAGNLARSKQLALECLDRADSAGFVKYQLAGRENLAVIAVYTASFDKARSLLDDVLKKSSELTYVHFGALDTLAQLELLQGRLDACRLVLASANQVLSKDSLPARSWYDLAHQITRCTYFEQLNDWDAIVEIADAADAELARRQYKAVRTTLLCAKARALARLGRQHDASAALATAVRICPRGAVDPLIVLEASKALCASLRGDVTNGRVHYDRALAACRAIGHRYHEWWIAAQQQDVQTRIVAVHDAPPQADVARTSLLLSDVATILGAGHSIDLLAHRVTAILQTTPMAARMDVVNESGREYRPEPAAEWELTPDGTCTLRFEGSDRLATISIRDVTSIEEISLMKGLADLVQIAVARTADTEREDEDLTLWPRTLLPDGEDTIFRSPRMMELLRVAERLAATNLPVLITGETGTGKEVLARFIHDHSSHKRGPFVPFNCSAVARELIESQLFGHRRGAFTGAVDSFPGVVKTAERGTLFLDEIGDLEAIAQPKLLRFLESGEIQPVGDVRPVNIPVRIVAATNADLESLAKAGRFRTDLFYRIGVVRLELPPLRERKDEIPAFAALFLSRFARECGRVGLTLADDLIAALLLYDWPGNIRQLANEIRRVTAMAADGETLTAAHLGPEITENWNARPLARVQDGSPVVDVRLDQPLTHAIAELERKFIEHAMQTSSGRIADAAELLGLSRKGLFLKRRRRGLT